MNTAKRILLKTVKNAVEFKNVSLTYTGSKVPSVDNINLTIKKGETIGIIGGTDSGQD